MPLRPRRMWQPPRQWRRVSWRILSGGILRGQLRQDGHALQLWRTAWTLSHPRVLHVQRTAYHVRCQSTRRSPKNVKIKSAHRRQCLKTVWCTRHSVRPWISPRGWFLMDCSESRLYQHKFDIWENHIQSVDCNLSSLSLAQGLRLNKLNYGSRL